MSNGNRKGFKGALPFNLGILVGFSVVMILCTAFCSLLSAWTPKIIIPMLIVGVCYMLYLAWETFRRPDTIEENHSRDGFWAGLLLQFINPKIYIYCIMSMEAYILPLYNGQVLPLVSFALLLAFIGFLFTLLWSAFGSVFKWLFPNMQSLSIPLWRFSLSIAPYPYFWHKSCNEFATGGRDAMGQIQGDLPEYSSRGSVKRRNTNRRPLQ